jgi:GNAT superfamily N-acetyltransferase
MVRQRKSVSARRKPRSGNAAAQAEDGRGEAVGRIALRIRRARPEDVASVVALDRRTTGLPKAQYWEDVFKRYGRRRSRERFFFVAEPLDTGTEPALLGFMVGEVRAWEFGSAPCGWIFALSVEPHTRLRGIGEALFNAISAQFRAAGVTKLRTMVARDHTLPMRFFRGEGMVAGPYIQLEKDIA